MQRLKKLDHPLRLYLNDVGEPLQAFAERVDTSRQTLYRICNGNLVPRPQLAARIVEATGGAVTFNMLYGGADQRSAEVVQLVGREEAEAIDFGRMRTALTIVINHLTPETVEPEADLVAIGVEAVSNTYEALASVTTLHGPDRLAQALRPVLEEMLKELTVPLPSNSLDRGAELAAQMYFQTIPAARYRPDY